MLLALTILAIWFGYKKAKVTGRNAILWGFICAGTFIGVQFFIAFGIAVFLGFGVELWGWSPTLYNDYTNVINIVCIVASIAALLRLFRYLDKVPEPEVFTPPPPPNFNQPN